MLRINRNKGFHLVFENKLTISVQFGYGNYCDNYNSEILDETKQRVTESTTAEIAIWDENDHWFKFDGDTVKGWVKADEIGIWIDKVRRAKNIKSIKQIKS